MTTKPGARMVLRSATAADHERVDRAIGNFDLGDPRQYTAFLAAQADSFLPVEAGIDRIDMASMLPDWPSRRRSDALLADLADLGVVSHIAA